MNRLMPTHIRLALWAITLVMLIAAAGNLCGDLRAAEAAPADAPAAAEAGGENTEAGGPQSFGQLLLLKTEWFGLSFYVVLAIFSISALAVAMERTVNLRRQKVMPSQFVRSLLGLVQRGEDTLENFRNLCDTSTTPVANVLKAGVLRAGRPLPEVEKAMEDAAAREMGAMRSRNRLLSVVGSVAPLVGLLGTVVGMIFAFRVSSQAGLGKAELLAEGIYLALMTTAAGLTIAIPCLLLVAWFNGRVERYMREMDENLLEVMPSFTRMENKT